MALLASCQAEKVGLIPVASVALDTHSVTLEVGTAHSFTAIVLPIDADNQKMSWSSDDDTIVSVDQNGTVTALSPGETTITVTTDENKKTDTAIVIVDGEPEPLPAIEEEFFGIESANYNEGEVPEATSEISFSEVVAEVVEEDSKSLVTIVSTEELELIFVSVSGARGFYEFAAEEVEAYTPKTRADSPYNYGFTISFDMQPRDSFTMNISGQTKDGNVLNTTSVDVKSGKSNNEINVLNRIVDPAFLLYCQRSMISDSPEDHSQWDENLDGILSLEEAAKVTYINVRADQIVTMDGLQYFTGLRYLDCSYNQLKALDIYNNPNLNELVCNYNPGDGISRFRVNARFDNSNVPDNFTKGNWMQRIDLVSTSITVDYGGEEVVEFNVLGLIQDPIFREYSRRYDTDNNRVLTREEASAAKTMMIMDQNIASLTGIEYFTGLTELRCNGNKLTSINLSKNTALEILDVSDNSLASLSVAGCKSLRVLRCDNNSLSSILGLRETVDLSILNCSGNRLGSLDLSYNTALNTVKCDNNQITMLDISKCAVLSSLDCSHNKLTSLDVSGCPEVGMLFCSSNSLSSLDITNNREITNLEVESNIGDAKYAFPIMAWFDNESIPSLQIFPTEGWYYYLMTIKPDYINATLDENLLTLDYIPDTGFRNYCKDQMDLWDTNKDDILSAAEVAAVERINAPNCDIKSMEGLQYFTGLKYLNCSNNDLKSLDITANTELIEFICEYNPGDNVSKFPVASWFDNNSVPKDFTNATWRSTDGKRDIIVDYGGERIVNIFTHFNDPAFITYCRRFDTNRDNMLTEEEAAVVTEITAANLNIKSLAGIQFFTNLTKLDCYGNELTSLNLSSNTKLKSLNCSDNSIRSLDISKHISLETVNCSGNDLTLLSVAPKSWLKSLFCNDNNLSSLNVSENANLESLNCSNNNLSALDVSHNTKLSVLHCSGNILTELDVDLNINLTDLRCFNNDLAELSIYRNKLAYLDCSDNNLKSLDISESETLKTFTCHANPGDGVSKFPVKAWFGNLFVPSGFTTLTWYHSVAAIRPDYINVNEEEEEDEGINIFDEITAPAFLSYCQSFDTNDNGVLSQTEANAVTNITVASLNITSLEGIEYFTKLTDLNCGGNGLTSLDLSKNTALKRLVCSTNRLPSLDITNNTALESVDCNMNIGNTLTFPVKAWFNNKTIPEGFFPIKSWTIGMSTITIDCGSDGSTGVFEEITDPYFLAYCQQFDTDGDGVLTESEANAVTRMSIPNWGPNGPLMFKSLAGIGNFTQLVELQCTSLGLTSLDVSKNTNLEVLVCDQNLLLPSVDVSKNTKLKALSCTYIDALTSLDVSNNPDLEVLNLGRNPIASLDVSNNPKLKQLQIGGTKISSIDLSNNLNLEFFSAENANGSGSLTSLDLSKNTKLKTLRCTGNQLASLDISASPGLTSLHCHDNPGNGSTFPITAWFDNGSIPSTLNIYRDSWEWEGNTIIADFGGGAATPFNALDYITDGVLNAYCQREFDRNQDGRIARDEIVYAQNITLPNSGVTSLAGIEYLEDMVVLDISGNSISSIDISMLDDLSTLKCTGTDLTSLDISKNTYLRVLYCDNTDISSLDISKNSFLTELKCNNSKISSLNISNSNGMLSALSITGCGFTTLNIPATLHLSELICNENNLTSLDLSGQIHLTSLQCDDNNLTSLKLPTSLWKLFCRNNRLTSLDLSGNDMLDMVYCGGNLLTSLDASDCQTLGTLSCEDNPGDGESKFPVKVWLDEDGEMYYDGISVPEPWVYGDATIAVELEM